MASVLKPELDYLGKNLCNTALQRQVVTKPHPQGPKESRLGREVTESLVKPPGGMDKPSRDGLAGLEHTLRAPGEEVPFVVHAILFHPVVRELSERLAAKGASTIDTTRPPPALPTRVLLRERPRLVSLGLMKLPSLDATAKQG